MATSVTPASPHLSYAWRHADPYADALAEARALRTWQRLAIASGVTSLAPGLVLLFWPDRTLWVAASAMGGWFLVTGVICLIEAVVAGEASSGSRALSAVAGLLYLIVGIVCVRHLLPAANVLAIVVGTAWTAGGLSEVISAVTGQRGGWARLGAVAAGAISTIGGLTLAFWLDISLTTLMWISGLGLLAFGTVQAVLAVRASHPGPLPR